MATAFAGAEFVEARRGHGERVYCLKAQITALRDDFVIDLL